MEVIKLINIGSASSFGVVVNIEAASSFGVVVNIEVKANIS